MRRAAPLSIIFALTASRVLAGETCDLARQVGSLDVSSRLLLKESEPASADRIIARMAGDLSAVAPPAPSARPPEPGSAQARMRAYIASRETLVQVYGDRGLNSAQDFLRSYRTAQSNRSIESELDCDSPPG